MSIRYQLLLSTLVATFLIIAQSLVVAYFNNILKQETTKLLTYNELSLSMDLADSSSNELIDLFKTVPDMNDSSLSGLKQLSSVYVEDVTKHANNMLPYMETLQLSEEDQSELKTLVQTLSKEQTALNEELDSLDGDWDAEYIAEITIFVEEPLEELIRFVGILSNTMKKDIRETSDKVSEIQSKPLVYGLSLAVITSILLAVFGLLFARRIVEVLKKITRQTSLIKDGTLNQPPLDLSGKDELCEVASAVDDMQLTLCNLITQVKEGTGDITNFSQEFSKISNSARARSLQQGQRVEAMGERLKSLLASSQEIDDNASRTLDQTKQMSSESEVVQSSVSSMGSESELLRKDFQEVLRGTEDLNETTSRIVSTLDNIESIAEQTNLLALNAAIESARAGEAGRGFAVVADEVRNLAKNSRESASEIKEMVDDLSQVLETVNASMTKSQSSTENVVNSIVRVNTSVESILSFIKQIETMNSDIAATVSHQNELLAEVKSSVDEVVEAEVDASADSELTETESRKLVEMGSRMSDTTSRFIT